MNADRARLVTSRFWRFELKDDVVEQTRGERVGNFLFQQAIARYPDFSVNRPLWTAASLRLADAEVTVLFP